MGKLVDIRVSAIRKQVDNLVSFVTKPRGLFETVDTAVKTFREANRQMLKELGIPVRGRMIRRR